MNTYKYRFDRTISVLKKININMITGSYAFFGNISKETRIGPAEGHAAR
jgi:hypothetical protein